RSERLGARVARPPLRCRALGTGAGSARGRPGRRQRAGRALGAALVAGAERVGPRRRTGGAVRLRRRPGAPRRGSGRGPRREGGAGSPRRVSRRQRLYFTPRSAARRRGGNSRAVDTRLTVSPMLVEARSEEHTSELQSRFDRVCRLLLEKKNKCPRAPG